jgi:hypothetical protein
MASFVASKPSLLHRPTRNARLSAMLVEALRPARRMRLRKSGGARLKRLRKLRTAWRVSRIAWFVLHTEGRIVGRGAWHGGRLAARMSRGRRRRHLHRRHLDRRAKMVMGAIVGVATMCLLRRRRGDQQQQAELADVQLSLAVDDPGYVHDQVHSGHNGTGAGATAAL